MYDFNVIVMCVYMKNIDVIKIKKERKGEGEI